MHSKHLQIFLKMKTDHKVIRNVDYTGINTLSGNCTINSTILIFCTTNTNEQYKMFSLKNNTTLN